MKKKSKFKKYLLIFLCVYFLSYLFLSRAFLYFNEFHNLNDARYSTEEKPYFYYIPVNEIVFKDHESLFIGHMALYYFYWPVYWVDYNILSGPYCSKSLPLWELL